MIMIVSDIGQLDTCANYSCGIIAIAQSTYVCPEGTVEVLLHLLMHPSILLAEEVCKLLTYVTRAINLCR